MTPISSLFQSDTPVAFPDMMKALRFHAKGDIRLEDVPLPTCAPDEVRLKVAYCGICGTDIHEYLGGPIFPPRHGERHPHTGAELPVIMGHEVCGTVIEVGKEVSGVSVGQRVAVNPGMDDRHHGKAPCTACLSGRHKICKNFAIYGLSAHGGGFSQEITVRPFALVPLPDNVPLKIAGLAEPLAVAAHMIRMSRFAKGDNVVVLGAGPIGCALTFLLKHKGAHKILVSEVAESRAKQAARFGADKVVDPLSSSGSSVDRPAESDPVLSAVHELMGEDGADVSFDACGIQKTLETAIACTRPGGVVFNVAIHEKPLSLQLNSLSLSEKTLTGGMSYTKQDFDDVIQILSEHGKEVERLITFVVPLADVITGGFKELINNTANHVKILIKVDSNK